MQMQGYEWSGDYRCVGRQIEKMVRPRRSRF